MKLIDILSRLHGSTDMRHYFIFNDKIFTIKLKGNEKPVYGVNLVFTDLHFVRCHERLADHILNMRDDLGLSSIIPLEFAEFYCIWYKQPTLSVKRGLFQLKTQIGMEIVDKREIINGS